MVNVGLYRRIYLFTNLETQQKESDGPGATYLFVVVHDMHEEPDDFQSAWMTSYR